MSQIPTGWLINQRFPSFNNQKVDWNIDLPNRPCFSSLFQSFPVTGNDLPSDSLCPFRKHQVIIAGPRSQWCTWIAPRVQLPNIPSQLGRDERAMGFGSWMCCNIGIWSVEVLGDCYLFITYYYDHYDHYIKAWLSLYNTVFFFKTILIIISLITFIIIIILVTILVISVMIVTMIMILTIPVMMMMMMMMMVVVVAAAAVGMMTFWFKQMTTF